MKITTIALRVLAPIAALVTAVGVATPAQAAGVGYAGTYWMNTYYGAASGSGTIYSPGDGSTTVSVSGYLRDTRNDGYCATLQMRAGNSTWFSGWYNAGYTCSTDWSQSPSGKTLRFTGGTIDRVQVRACQSNRNGAVIGTCAAPVWVSGWRAYV